MDKSNAARLRVLIADGNAHHIAIVKTMLRGFGLREIFEATDGTDALDTLKQREVDIGLIGLHLNEIDGLEMARLIRFAPDSQSPSMPIILMVPNPGRAVVEAAISAGVDEILAIPVSAKNLIERIVRRLESPRTYVRYGSYFGPDRRRRADADYRGPNRRQEAEQASG